MINLICLLFLSTPADITAELNQGYVNAYGTNESIGISFEIKEELKSVEVSDEL